MRRSFLLRRVLTHARTMGMAHTTRTSPRPTRSGPSAWPCRDCEMADLTPAPRGNRIVTVTVTVLQPTTSTVRMGGATALQSGMVHAVRYMSGRGRRRPRHSERIGKTSPWLLCKSYASPCLYVYLRLFISTLYTDRTGHTTRDTRGHNCVCADRCIDLVYGAAGKGTHELEYTSKASTVMLRARRAGARAPRRLTG